MRPLFVLLFVLASKNAVCANEPKSIQGNAGNMSLDSVEISFRPSPTLLGFSPEQFAQIHPKCVSVLFRLRNIPILNLCWGHSQGAFSVNLSSPTDPMNSDNKPPCSLPGSWGSDDEKKLTLTFPSGERVYRLSLKCRSVCKHQIHGKPESSETKETLLIRGKKEKHAATKGIVRFTFHSKTDYDFSITELKARKTVLRKKWTADGTCKGTITLKLCHQINWYFGEVDYNGYKEGSGWREVPRNQEQGVILYEPHHTLMLEEFEIFTYSSGRDGPRSAR